MPHRNRFTSGRGYSDQRYVLTERYRDLDSKNGNLVARDAGRSFSRSLALWAWPESPKPRRLRQAAHRRSKNSSFVESVEKVNDRQLIVNDYAASMNRKIPIQVITAADPAEPRLILYLLNGAGGGEDSSTWQRQTDVVDFFVDKNVNVATPVGGRLSYYTDWEKDDPQAGRNQWSTFLGTELPPLLNKD